MPEHNECFTPDEVDEQIEHFSSSLHSPQLQGSSRSSGELVQPLWRVLGNGCDSENMHFSSPMTRCYQTPIGESPHGESMELSPPLLVTGREGRASLLA